MFVHALRNRHEDDASQHKSNTQQVLHLEFLVEKKEENNWSEYAVGWKQWGYQPLI